MNSGIYAGTLVHCRREPVRNVFRYPLSFFVLDLDELPAARAQPQAPVGQPPQRRDAAGQGSLRRHAAGQGGRHSLLRRAGRRGRARADARPTPRGRLRLQPGHVLLVLRPRWGAGGRRGRAQQHLRRAASPSSCAAPSCSYGHDKHLHVSPFFGLDQSYEYAFSEPGDEVWARIHVRQDGRLPLTAVLHGRRSELTNASLARFLVRYPLMPLQVIGLIHWQAVKLLAKRVPFHHKPPYVPGVGSVKP